MGLIQPDLLVRDALIDGLALVKADPTLLVDVFGDRPAEEVAEIEQWFGENDVPVRLGFPRGAADLPGLYVFLMSSTESRQLVGGQFPDSLNDPTPADQSEFRGSYFNTGVRVACWSINADLTVWLQNIALWILMGNRAALNKAGIHEQSITVADFEPIPQWFPDFAFRRDLSLTGLHPVTVKQVFQKVAEIEVEATAISPPGGGQTYRAVLRSQ